MLSSSDFSVERRKRVLILWFFRWLRGRQFWKFFPNVWMFGLTARSFICRITQSRKNGDRHRGRSQFPFFHATSWSCREERGRTPQTESVPFPPWSRCEWGWKRRSERSDRSCFHRHEIDGERFCSVDCVPLFVLGPQTRTVLTRGEAKECVSRT